MVPKVDCLGALVDQICYELTPNIVSHAEQSWDLLVPCTLNTDHCKVSSQMSFATTGLLRFRSTKVSRFLITVDSRRGWAPVKFWWSEPKNLLLAALQRAWGNLTFVTGNLGNIVAWMTQFSTAFCAVVHRGVFWWARPHFFLMVQNAPVPIGMQILRGDSPFKTCVNSCKSEYSLGASGHEPSVAVEPTTLCYHTCNPCLSGTCTKSFYLLPEYGSFIQSV